MFDLRKALILAALSFVLPAAQAAAQAVTVFHLGPSDEIEISVWNEPTLSATAVVRPDGKISLPLVGTLDVAGRTPEDVEADLKERFRPYLQEEPIVVVVVSGFNNAQVSVVGEVQRPGRFPLLQRLSVLEAVATAGGFTDYADIDNIIVLRPEESEAGIVYQHIRVNVKELLESSSRSMLMLLPGDIVYVK